MTKQEMCQRYKRILSISIDQADPVNSKEWISEQERPHVLGEQNQAFLSYQDPRSHDCLKKKGQSKELQKALFFFLCVCCKPATQTRAWYKKISE